jgi:hypothetical protein
VYGRSLETGGTGVRRAGLGWAVLGLLVAAAGLAAVPHGRPPRVVAGPRRTSPDVPPARSASAVRYVVTYPACGVTRAGTGPLPPAMRDLDRAALARALAPAQVEVVGETVVVTRALPGCPGDTVTLAAQGGVVVVLAGPPGDNPGVLRRTDVPVRGVAPGDARRLEVGWGVPAGALATVLEHLRRGEPAAPSGAG